MTTHKIDVVVGKDGGDIPDKIIIISVCGEATLDTLKDIEEMFNDPDLDFSIPPAPHGYMIEVVCSVYWDSGETQYGDAYGSMVTFDGYWYPNIEGYIVIEFNTDEYDNDTNTYFPYKNFDENLRNHVYVRSQQKINNTLDSYSGATK